MRSFGLIARCRLLRSSFVHAVFLLLLIPLAASAAPLDDHYLAAFGAQPGNALEKAILSTITPTEAVRSGTPIRHGLKKDWDKLEPATQKTLAKYLASPVLSGTQSDQRILTSLGGHFNIHYTVSGADAPNITAINQDTPGLGLTSIADWAAQVATSFEGAYSYYVGLGYKPPPSALYDVYLVSLVAQKSYGLTQSLNSAPSAGFPFAFTSFIEIDSDFTNSIYQPTTYTPLQSLQVTSVHEFHHAVQYGYNIHFDIWYAEATSTWFEGELYPIIKQLYGYIPGWFANSTHRLDLPQTDSGFNTEAYGRWLLNRYLTEKHTAGMVRSIWEAIAGMTPPSDANGFTDIPMVPVLESVISSSYNSTFAADYFGFAKRVYTRDWPSSTTSASDLTRIPKYTSINTFSSYPVSSTAASSVTLPDYSFAYYKFVPSAAIANLTITLSKTSGIQTAVFEKASGTISEISANAGGGSYTVNGFGSLNSNDEVVLLVANTTNVNNQSANFSTDGIPDPVTATPTPITTTTTPAASGGGGGGCFIATAAYGSYLHPKVAELRAFRDQYLLTNAPGRIFVALYYRLSPPVAQVIAQHEWMRAGVRVLLAPVVFTVEHPAAVLLVFSLSACGLVWRRTLRRRKLNRKFSRKCKKFIHLA